MRRDFTIGIDCGSTTTKAVVFTGTGEIVGLGRRRVPQHMDEPRHVERDMHESWHAVVASVRDALEDSGVDPASIAGVGVTAHGDGLFVLDRSRIPLGRGIMSLDSRAADLHDEWKREGRLEKVVPVTGQRPYPYSANTLLAWMKRYQPERYNQIGTVFFAKDWIRLCLTGEIATDLTEASTSFTDLYTQEYSATVLDILDIREIKDALPPMRLSCEQGGTITREAAAATGLLEGTPVSVGLHDVTAAAVGLGYTQPGDLSITAGTFSINEIFRSRPVIGDGWACRAGYRRGLWNCMAISPASSSNLEWLARMLLPEEKEAAQILAGEVEAKLGRSRAERPVPLYHPFLFGSPYEAPASASLFGVQSWHDRADLFQAMIEGTIFNHREHVETLSRTGAIRRLGVSGGGSGQPSIAQMFADILNMPVEISSVREAGALGAALTAGVAVGLYDSLEAAVAAQDIPMNVYQPEPERARIYEGIYQRYVALTRAMQPFWSGLYEVEVQEKMGSEPLSPVLSCLAATETVQEIRP